MDVLRVANQYGIELRGQDAPCLVSDIGYWIGLNSMLVNILYYVNKEEVGAPFYPGIANNGELDYRTGNDFFTLHLSIVGVNIAYSITVENRHLTQTVYSKYFDVERMPLDNDVRMLQKFHDDLRYLIRRGMRLTYDTSAIEMVDILEPLQYVYVAEG